MQTARDLATTPPPRVPAWLAGLWRREAILFPDGSADRTTQVLWGQTHTLYVDLRIPANRPPSRGRRSFDDFTLEELQRLAEQKGFAGHIAMDGDLCSWVRYIDYRPNTGRPDSGRLRLEGDTLYEEGDPSSVLASAYREIYHRERKADRRSVALRLLDADADGPLGCGAAGAVLVLIDDRFLLARPRSIELPPAETIRELIVAADDDRELIHAYLDCEISFGRIDEGDEPWMIASSTIPFRQGQRLLPRGAARVGDRPDLLTLANDDGVLYWHAVESTMAPDELARLFGQ